MSDLDPKIHIGTVSDAQQGSPGTQILLKVEVDARRAETVAELAFLIANETAVLAHAQQVFLVTKSGHHFRMEAASSVGQINRDAPRIRWIEEIVRNLAADGGLQDVRDFVLPAYCRADHSETTDYPYRHMLFVPLKLREGHVFAGMILTRNTLWAKPDIAIAKRLAETFSHAWAALTGTAWLRRRPFVRPFLWVSALVLVVAGMIPVPLAVLAPVEIRSVEPQVITAPADGVVASVAVNPDDPVAAGQLLIRLSDMMLRNDLAVAEKDVAVAHARLKQITQKALGDAQARSDLAVARSETAVALAKRDYAQELLTQTAIVAPAGGVAIFTDKADWIGRPVSTGMRLMEIANPHRVQLRIDVPVADVLAIRPGAAVRAFLDSDPLNPLDATIKIVSFEAQPVENNVLAYRIYAEITDKTREPRLGVRGTAQVFGDNVPLVYYLFRRPIAALRQRLGL